MDYTNVPVHMGTIISSRLATLQELQTIYGTQDAYDLLEVISIDKHNELILDKLKQDKT